MAILNIKDAKTYELASESGRRQEETLTQAVERVVALGRNASSRPILDSRSPDEIIGYDELGIPR